MIVASRNTSIIHGTNQRNMPYMESLTKGLRCLEVCHCYSRRCRRERKLSFGEQDAVEIKFKLRLLRAKDQTEDVTSS